MLRARDIRKLTVEEIEQRMEEAQEELWRLRFRGATENLENPLLIRERRREVARMRTILQEHQKDIRRLAQRDNEEASA